MSVRAAGAVLGVAAVAGLAGCGSGGESSSPTSTTIPPNAPPTGVSWATYQGMAVPCADQGPKSCWSAAASGFEHNGPGAALAAISTKIRMSVAPDNEWQQVVGALVEPSPARDEWAVNRTQVSFSGPVKADQAPVLVGYTVDVYTPWQADISIITREHDRSLTDTDATVVWSPMGDWKLRLPDGSASAVTVHSIAQLLPKMIPLSPKTS